MDELSTPFLRLESLDPLSDLRLLLEIPHGHATVDKGPDLPHLRAIVGKEEGEALPAVGGDVDLLEQDGFVLDLKVRGWMLVWRFIDEM
jgi:hypothetical protein